MKNRLALLLVAIAVIPTVVASQAGGAPNTRSPVAEVMATLRSAGHTGNATKLFRGVLPSTAQQKANLADSLVQFVTQFEGDGSRQEAVQNAVRALGLAVIVPGKGVPFLGAVPRLARIARVSETQAVAATYYLASLADRGESVRQVGLIAREDRPVAASAVRILVDRLGADGETAVRELRRRKLLKGERAKAEAERIAAARRWDAASPAETPRL